MTHLHLSWYKNDIKTFWTATLLLYAGDIIWNKGLCTINWTEEWWSQIFPQEPVRLNLEQSSAVNCSISPPLCSIK